METTNNHKVSTLPSSRKQAIIAVFTLAAIGLHLLLRFGIRPTGEMLSLPVSELPLVACLVFGGIPLVLALLTWARASRSCKTRR